MPSVMIYVRQADHEKFKSLYSAEWLHNILSDGKLTEVVEKIGKDIIEPEQQKLEKHAKEIMDRVIKTPEDAVKQIQKKFPGAKPLPVTTTAPIHAA